jgi:hypothetical protein
MNIVVKNNYLPLHEFQYMIRGYFPPDLVTYSTEIYIGQMIYSLTDTITGIAPRNDKAFQDSIGILENINIFWVVNKSFGPGIEDYDIMNTSGPHKIFLTYDTPLLDTVNTLALDKICRYANGKDSVRTIAQAGVNGIYNEHWDYNINHETFQDPLDVVRQHVGMCTDYANLLTCIYRSIGVTSNSVIIFNGLEYPTDVMNILWWNYTEVFINPETTLLTKRLTSCDNTTKNWRFLFHAVTSCSTYYCDASFGIFTSSSDYDAWWRYYLHPRNLGGNYNNAEPPLIPPVYYDWSYYIPTYVWPLSWIMNDYWSGWNHP